MNNLEKKEIYKLCKPHGLLEVCVWLFTMLLLIFFIIKNTIISYDLTMAVRFSIAFLTLLALGLVALKLASFKQQQKYEFITNGIKNRGNFYAVKNKDRNVYDLMVSKSDKKITISLSALNNLCDCLKIDIEEMMKKE